MATQLAIVKIDGKHYYQDDRLREYRLTTNPHERISFDELGERVVEEVEPRRELKQNFKRRLR
jgi:hypothetical protein